MVGHITYISDEQMGERFGRQLCAKASSIRSRPNLRSSRICATRARNSPNTSMRTPTCASPRRSTTSIRRWLQAAISRARLRRRQCRFLVISFTTDWRFAPARSREIVKALVDNRCDVSYAEIDAPHGHDAFLLDTPQYHAVVRTYLEPAETASGSAARLPAPAIEPDTKTSRPTFLRADFSTIAGWIAPRRARPGPGLRRRQPVRVSCASRAASRLRHRDRRRRRARLDRQRRQRDPERSRERPGRVRRPDLRLRNPVADPAGGAPHRGDRARDAARRARSDRHLSELRPLVAPARRSCAAGCRCRRACPISGTTRRTFTSARSQTSTRSAPGTPSVSSIASCLHDTRRVTVLPNLLGSLAIYRFRRS